jgi:short-subunit dehydrogenase
MPASRVAVVTGASSGIGEATARLLVREHGLAVVLVARREERLSELAASLGPDASTFAVDLTDDDAPGRVRDAVQERHGRLDLLVNNAGAAWRATFADGGWENVRRHMEVNFDAVVRLTEALLPLLRASAPSAIVNVSSTAGRVSRPGSGAYSASKFALAGWSDALQGEEAKNDVHVGLVLPGFISTEGFPQSELMRLFRDVMAGAPDELSLAFAYLTGPDAEPIPAEVRGRPAAGIVGMYAGPVEDAEAALAPIRAYGPPALDAFGPAPYAGFQASLDDPPGNRNWWTAEYLADLGDDAIEAIATLSEDLPPGLGKILVPAWGGAVARVPEDASPLAKRDARYVVHPLLAWPDAADDEAMVAFGRRYRDVLAPYRTGGTYLNWVADAPADRIRAAYGPAYDRLARVKAGWDPDNVFRATGNVQPVD